MNIRGCVTGDETITLKIGDKEYSNICFEDAFNLIEKMKGGEI